MANPVELRWEHVLRLHVVRRVGQLIERRFGTPPSLARASGEWMGGPDGSAPCALGAARSARTSHHATATGCKAHSSELAAPIRDGGHYRGCVYAPASPGTDLALLGELLELCADEIAVFAADTAPLPGVVPDSDAPPRYVYEGIIGRSRSVHELYRVLDKVIDSESTVLVQGENGTGKELIARAIHYNSRRAGERFVVQNCSAFNDNLLDSELFGHKRGAFTGAVADKPGLFEVADNGTFFLDEVGDMSPSLQVKLLRVLQEGTFIPVGDTQVRRTDTRIIAATHRDLKRMVEQGEFREDLYYRINVISVVVPPLRERRDDIPLLVDHFLRKFTAGRKVRHKRLTRACLEQLLQYAWPGNIRELENEIERLVVLAGDDVAIGAELLSPRLQQALAAAVASDVRPATLDEAVDAVERDLIVEVLKRTQGNQTRAAQQLHISRRSLLRKIDKHQIASKRAR